MGRRIHALLATVLLVSAAQAGVWHQAGADLAGGTFAGTQLDSLGRLTLTSFRGVNLALGSVGQSGDNALTGSRSVTDGDPSTEWRFAEKPEVLGQWIRLDLGGDRGVSQVRILPGKTYRQRPRFYLKGYRLEVAAEDTPDDWVLVAQQIDNARDTIDTTVDSTWIDWQADRAPRPALGRYVRLRIMREDPPNWVSIGEVQVFGEGYRAAGSYESEVFDAGQPVNFGVARFTGEAPGRTGLTVQFRSSADSVTWQPWHRLPAWTLAEGAAGRPLDEPEPARYLQYQVLLETFVPLRTPSLTGIEVAYDEALFASSLAGRIAPQRPVLGEETRFTYTVEAQVGAADAGFDRLWIGLPGYVEAVRVDGVPLPEEDYQARWQAGQLWVILAPAQARRQSGRLEVDFRGVLLQPTLAMRAAVGLGEAPNYQHVAPAAADAWTLVGRGQVARVLPRAGVRVTPNPFNAGRGSTQIQVDVAQVQLAQPVQAGLYDLSGRRVRTLWDGERLTAGRQRLEWDGRSDNGRLVPPGLYLLRIEVQADRADQWVGSVGVVY
ncbi:MAG: discoidin domain-containing protein [Candidatus Latescibacterota bacterium]